MRKLEEIATAIVNNKDLKKKFVDELKNAENIDGKMIKVDLTFINAYLVTILTFKNAQRGGVMASMKLSEFITAEKTR
jgi:hypothetical protein